MMKKILTKPGESKDVCIENQRRSHFVSGIIFYLKGIFWHYNCFLYKFSLFIPMLTTNRHREG